LLAITFALLSCLPFEAGRSEGITIYSSASSWAVPEIQQAYDYGLTYPGIMLERVGNISATTKNHQEAEA